MIFFRADSNPYIASGHIMRCISIAKKLQNQGQNIMFLVADNNSIAILDNANINYIILRSKWNDLLYEIPKIKKLLIQEYDPILFIDTYYVTKKYVETLLPYAKIFYLGSKQEYLGKIQCIINYSINIDYDFYKKNYPSDTKILLGPQYAPLREEFENIPEHYNKNQCRIILTTGNTDQKEYVSHILKALKESICYNEISISVIIGRMFHNKNKICTCFGHDKKILLHENVCSMASLMINSDLAISANGTTVYEFATAHVPVISFAMVEEQVKNAKALSALDAIYYAGEIYKDEEKCVNNIVKGVEKYATNPDLRIALGRQANKFIDGNGCNRIVEQIKNIIG